MHGLYTPCLSNGNHGHGHRQGCYSQEGDIVVLCAYLGQLAHVRDALASEVAVVIDDRDQMALADQEAENEDISEPGTGVEHVRVAKRVRLFYYESVLMSKSHLTLRRFDSAPSTIIKEKKQGSVSPSQLSFSV